MKCPKCEAAFTPQPDANGLFRCPGCGTRLRSKAAPGPAAAPPAPQAPSSADATLRPAPAAAAAAPAAPAPPPPALIGAALEEVIREIRSVRKTQEEILALLRARPSGAAAPPARPAAPRRLSLDDDDEDFETAPAAAAATAHQTLILLVDDDDVTRHTAAEALEAAGLAVKHATDGKGALEAIALEKPDAVAVEAELQGPMPGKDLINVIKATMEWVDIPIVLYTRAAVADENEARTLHGADGFVVKGPAAPAALAERIRAILQRG